MTVMQPAIMPAMEQATATGDAARSAGLQGVEDHFEACSRTRRPCFQPCFRPWLSPMAAGRDTMMVEDDGDGGEKPGERCWR